MTKLLTLLLLVLGASLLLSVEGRTLRANHVRAVLTPLPKAATNIVGQEVAVTNEHSTKSANHGISLRTMTINIIADLCPHGMLPLAYGLARGGPTGIIPAVFLVALFGAMSAYSMVVLAHLSKEVGAESIGDLWGRLKSKHSKWVIDASVMTLCYGCCVFNAAIVGDIFADFAQAMGLKALPRDILIVLPVSMVLPHCVMDDLSELQVTSAMGTVGIAYTVLFLVKRWLDQTYAPGSYFLKYVDPELRPHFTSSSSGLSWLRINSGTLVLANLLSVAFFAQHNAIPYFRELNGTLEQYRKGITYGFGITAVVFLTMMFVGYQMFGNAAQPLMLNNFSIKDQLATIARYCVGAAMVLSFLVMFIALRTAMFTLIDTATAPRNRSPSDIQSVSRVGSRGGTFNAKMALLTLVTIAKIVVYFNESEVESEIAVAVAALGSFVIAVFALIDAVTIIAPRNRSPADVRSESSAGSRMGTWKAIVAILTWVSIVTIVVYCNKSEVESAVGIVVSGLGCVVAYILPNYLNILHNHQRHKAGLTTNRREVALNYFMAILGALFGVLGVWMAVTNTAAHH
jgi:amino acid permease